MTAGDPGCLYNRHAWDEVVGDGRKQNELCVLGQHDPVDRFLAGATDGLLTTRITDPLVRQTLQTISDSIQSQRTA